jgi:hypothetical protein
MATGDFTSTSCRTGRATRSRRPTTRCTASQWHHPMIGSPTGHGHYDVWQLARSSPRTTDTGIDTTHPDLAPHRVPGYNAPANTSRRSMAAAINDVNGHGTHVAGCGCSGRQQRQGRGRREHERTDHDVQGDRCISAAARASYEILDAGARGGPRITARRSSARATRASRTSPIQTTGEYIKLQGRDLLLRGGQRQRKPHLV